MFICVSYTHEGSSCGQMMVSNPLEPELEVAVSFRHGFWETDSGPWHEQQMLLSAELYF